MELNRDQIIKALECCIKAETFGDCNKMGCPASRKQGCHFYLRTDDDYEDTIYIELIKDALALIKELTEENKTLLIKFQAMKGAANSYKTHCEKLSEEIFNAFERGQNQAKADTVRKIKTQVHNKAVYPSTKGDVAYISLKAFDALVDGLISDKN